MPIGSWIEKAIEEFENCERRKLVGCSEKCPRAQICGLCFSPDHLIALRERGMADIDEETIRKITKEKERIVKEKIKKILKKSYEERSWVERRYLELWLPRES